MIELNGKHNSAKVFIDNVDTGTISQIIELCNQKFAKDSKIRIMPDCHVGAGCTIGTTMTITDKIVPNLVGVDIGCGVCCYRLGKIDIDFKELDKFINESIPSGFKVNKESQIEFKQYLEKLRCLDGLSKSISFFEKSIGTLGGGNHFIEVNVDFDGEYYLTIHSGSRNLGKQVAEYYQKKAIEYCTEKYKDSEDKKPKDALCYLEGDLMQDYLHDMNIVQVYATFNRELMVVKIARHLRLNPFEIDGIESVHNFIDMKNMILRKGAIPAERGQGVIIPLNMKDGSIIGIGKGNEDWNCSAPHGAGRVLGRGQAKRELDLEHFKDMMKDVYTTSVNESTLDESPQAYKPMDWILSNINETVEVLTIIKPVYSFKSN